MKTSFLIFFLILISKVGIPRDIIINSGDSAFTYRYSIAGKYSKSQEKISSCKYKGRFALNTGYSYCYASIIDLPSDYKDYEKGLKSGFHFGGDFSVYMDKHLGFGFKASMFKSGEEKLDGNKISDNISIGYIALEFCLRAYSLNQKNMLYYSFSMGYAGYTNKSVYYIPITKKANTFAWGMDLGYEFGISEHIAVGFQLSTLAGRLKKLENTINGQLITVDLDKDEYEHLGRIDLSLGLRVWF